MPPVDLGSVPYPDGAVKVGEWVDTSEHPFRLAYGPTRTVGQGRTACRVTVCQKQLNDGSVEYCYVMLNDNVLTPEVADDLARELKVASEAATETSRRARARQHAVREIVRDLPSVGEAAVLTPHVNTLLTPTEAAKLCGVAAATIRSWAFRGILNPSDTDENGHNLYRYGDVIVAASARRR